MDAHKLYVLTTNDKEQLNNWAEKYKAYLVKKFNNPKMEVQIMNDNIHRDIKWDSIEYLGLELMAIAHADMVLDCLFDDNPKWDSLRELITRYGIPVYHYKKTENGEETFVVE